MNKEEILYQIVAVDSELKKGFPDEITTILKNGITGKTYTDYDFKNHRYLYCFINDNFNIYDRLEEKDKEIKRLNKKYEDAVADYEQVKFKNIEAIKILNDGLKELDKRGRNEVYIEEYLENALDELQGSDK